MSEITNPFDFNEGDIQGRGGWLDEPYAGQATLASLEVLDRPGRNEGDVYDSITSTWNLLSDPKKGMRFSDTQYGPDPSIPSFQDVQANPNKEITIAGQPTTVKEAFDRVANTWKRVAHLLHPWLGTEEALALVKRHNPITVTPAQAWKTLRAEIAEKCASILEGSDKVLNVKVVANLRGSKPKLQFPGYPGFVSENSVLTLSNDERADAVRYKNLREAAATDMASAGGDGAAMAQPATRASF